MPVPSFVLSGALRPRSRYLALFLLVVWVMSLCRPSPCNAVEIPSFGFETLQKEIKNISQEIKEASISHEELESAKKQTQGFLQQANTCIEATTTRISQVDREITSLGPSDVHELEVITRERRKLVREKQSLQVRLSECRLISTLSIRLSNEIADRDRVQQKADFLSKTGNLYSRIESSMPSWVTFRHQLLIYSVNRSGLAKSQPSEIMILLLLAAAGGFVGRYLFKMLASCLAPTNRLLHSDRITPLGGSPAMAAAMATLAAGAYLWFLCRNTISDVYGPWLLFSITICCLAIVLLRFPTFLRQGQDRLTSVAPPIHRIRLLIILCVLLYFFFNLNLEGFSALTAPMALLQTLLICAICLNCLWALWSIELPSGLVRLRGLFRITVAIFSLLVIVVELAGYRNLSIFFLIGGIGTLGLATLLRTSLFAINEIIGGFVSGKYRWQQQTRRYFGITSNQDLTGMIWVGFLFKILAWFIAFFLLLQVWGLSASQRRVVTSYLINGVNIGGLSIAPIRIVLGIFIFSCCWTLVTWIKMRMDKQWLNRANVSRSAQETLVTATGYAGFAMAVVIGLSIAGVSFSNLAVIAGALSVGIGFGLQNIVNNFVSGLIILFERPIKRGDWISVGNTQGYVQKISVRSTLIQTFDRSDVIVPNSELISNQVTNMMLHDRYGRLIVPVGVAYGSDTELVRSLLLDIAHANDKVINNGSVLEPYVLFLEFGESSLNFELRCYLNNIDERFTAKSEINFAIDKAFREHKITIPFPQRDLYIKEFPGTGSTVTEKKDHEPRSG